MNFVFIMKKFSGLLMKDAVITFPFLLHWVNIIQLMLSGRKKGHITQEFDNWNHTKCTNVLISFQVGTGVEFLRVLL